MKIDPANFINSTVKPIAKKSLESINEIGKVTCSLGDAGIKKFDSFVKNQTETNNIAKSIKKAGVNKYTFVGSAVAAAAIYLAAKGAISFKNKIIQIRQEDK